jgi:hypothetical protein
MFRAIEIYELDYVAGGTGDGSAAPPSAPPGVLHVDYLPNGQYIGNGIAPGDSAGGGLSGVIPLSFDLGDVQASVSVQRDGVTGTLSTTQGNTTSSVSASTNGTFIATVSTNLGNTNVTATASTNGSGTSGSITVTTRF